VFSERRTSQQSTDWFYGVLKQLWTFRSLRVMKNVERMMQVIDLSKLSSQSWRVSVELMDGYMLNRKKVSQFRMNSQMERNWWKFPSCENPRIVEEKKIVTRLKKFTNFFNLQHVRRLIYRLYKKSQSPHTTLTCVHSMKIGFD
jgi:hypothetical protein